MFRQQYQVYVDEKRYLIGIYSVYGSGTNCKSSPSG